MAEIIESKIPISPFDLIKQPNRVTNAKHSYTLNQQKILITIIKELQPSINEQLAIKPGSPFQLTLFKENDGLIQLRLPVKNFSVASNHNKELFNDLDELRKLTIEFPYKDKNGVDYTRYTGLITDFGFPVNKNDDNKKKYKKDILIWINKAVAEKLILIDGGYTQLAYDVIKNCKCKYTPKLYSLLCRFKDQGGYKTSLEKFRELFVLGDDYSEFKDLKKRVLNPVYNELKEKADVWFEFDKVMSGRTVTGINFKIITRDFLKTQESKRNNVIHLLKTYYSFNEDQLKQLRPIIYNNDLVHPLTMKFVEIDTIINKSKDIENRTLYMLTSLKNAFKKHYKA